MFCITVEFKFPDVGEGIHEGRVVKWHFKEGESVKADQTMVEVETDKAVVELPAPAAGTIIKRNFKEGEVVKVGEVLVVIGEGTEAGGAGEAKKASAAAPVKAHAEAPVIAPVPMHPLATPAVRGIARELGVDLAKVRGTGPSGRISEDDVRKAAGGRPPETRGAAEAGRAKAAVAGALPPVQDRPPMRAPKVLQLEGDERIPLTPLRRIIAERMAYSKRNIPHACGMDFVDVTKLSEIRDKEKKAFKPKGVKLTYLPFIVKASAIALKEYPRFNAHFDSERNELVIRKQHNIGIAVDTPEGLTVPVVKDVDRRSIIEIAQEIEHLAETARARKLRLEDISGSTFSITNVGSVGGMYSTPIINPPEVAIMGVHRIREMPLVIGGKVKPRMVMGISLCFDHRVADGAEATMFMNTVMKHLEDPDLMLVDMI